MKAITFFSLCLLILSACSKKTGEPVHNPVSSCFSYSGYEVTDSVKVTSERYDDVLRFTLAKYDGDPVGPYLYFDIVNFNGPGTYLAKDGVGVYAAEADDLNYWTYQFYWDDPDIRAYMKMVVKQKGDFLSAEIEGLLMHEVFDGQETNRSYTPLHAFTDRIE